MEKRIQRESLAETRKIEISHNMFFNINIGNTERPKVQFSIQTFSVFPLNFPTVHRPTMSEAVSMLTNEIVNIPLPISLLFKPKAFS
ncbi:hypothetical protein CUMW_163640 [Citrus unshiu]|nr:hypothetical protein CUMW_163640 [Citrus unshiu]